MIYNINKQLISEANKKSNSPVTNMTKESNFKIWGEITTPNNKFQRKLTNKFDPSTHLEKPGIYMNEHNNKKEK